MFHTIYLALVAFASQTSAACSRDLLQQATDSYIKAQAAGLQNSAISLLASNFSYMENDVPTAIQDGILNQPITIDYNRSLHDTTACTTFTELSAATNKHPYVIHTRMLLTDSEISAIQSVITDDGDWAFNATGQLRWNTQETWSLIPEAERDSRAVIQAAGDAYLDSWGNATVKVPYGTPCARLEGGAYTGGSNPSGNTCVMPQFPLPFYAGNRRYVVDETVGAVDIFNDFPFIDKTRPNGTSSTNFIRVEKGGIRYIHEVTVCATKNCGR